MSLAASLGVVAGTKIEHGRILGDANGAVDYFNRTRLAVDKNNVKRTVYTPDGKSVRARFGAGMKNLKSAREAASIKRGIHFVDGVHGTSEVLGRSVGRQLVGGAVGAGIGIGAYAAGSAIKRKINQRKGKQRSFGADDLSFFVELDECLNRMEEARPKYRRKER
jgi:hypothetical protein